MPALVGNFLLRERQLVCRARLLRMGLRKAIAFGAIGVSCFLAIAAWGGAVLDALLANWAAVSGALFALSVFETAAFCSRQGEIWRHGWLAGMPDFDRRCREGLATRLLLRTVARLTLALGTLLAMSLSSGSSALETAPLIYGVSAAIVGGNLGGLSPIWILRVLVGYWPVSGRTARLRVLRVSPLTARLPGRIWVWQLTTALTAWRTPTAAWWCAPLLLSVPSGSSPAIFLVAFSVGATAAAWQLSLAVAPKAKAWLRHPPPPASDFAVLPFLVLGSGAGMGVGLLLALGASAMHLAVGLALVMGLAGLQALFVFTRR